ncbi:MAG: hypothetical protein K5866_08870 [Treponema sp.]|nr:hypothetical protein [Treponema sp.]
MTSIELPKSSRKRLVLLLGILKSWPDKKITSLQISDKTNWKSSLIRHDLWLIKFNKGISNGYNVQELIKAIEIVLGIEESEDSESQNNKDRELTNEESSDNKSSEDSKKKICIVGLGRLGAALLDNNLVEDSVFEIKAGFDPNLYRVEILRSTFPLYPCSEMNFVIKKEKIEYAILTLADKEAQKMADRLVQAGIKGIVNMTSTILKTPEEVKVQNISIINALTLVLNSKAQL